MSILQQGDPQGELRVADICKESVAVIRRERKGRTRWMDEKRCSVGYIAAKRVED